MYWQGFIDAYLWTWTMADRRVDGWIFMSSIKPVLGIVVCYLVMSYIGLRWMENRPPIINKPMALMYGLSVVLLNAYILFKVILGGYRLKFKWTCDAIDYNSTSDKDIELLNAVRLYMFSKILELMDSVFVILFKIKHQPNLFYRFHHSSMVIISWMILRFVPGGSSLLYVAVNTATHVFTYGYVCCFLMGPAFRRRWLSQCLKQLTGFSQFLQYNFFIIFSLHGIFSNCDFPHFIFHLFFWYTPTLLLLTVIVYPAKKVTKIGIDYETKGIELDVDLYSHIN